jgi:polysaccharide biosynthesis/export protein
MQLLAILLSFLAVCLAGDGAVPTSAVPPVADLVVAAPATPPPSQQDRLYRIGPGDVLQVQVYGEGTLTGPFPVDDAGQLDFPLIGALPVSGLSAAEVATLLRGRLSPGYLVNPNVTVWIASYRSQPVQVLGGVAKPGVYFLRGPTTVMQILSEAGGVDTDGVNEVRLTHSGRDDHSVVIPYDRLLADSSTDVALAAGDIVFVPQSVISVMGLVGKPGEIAFREGLTLSTCIASAGGTLPTADLGRVYILRGDKRIRFSLRKILSGKAADVVLQPGDKVYVGESIV